MASDTKESILDAAEKLFAERGFSGTSLRTITAAARVNLAAVNYHFGSKDALIEAVLARRVRPMNAERVARLDRARAKLRHVDRQIDQEKEILARIVRQARQHGAQPDWFR